MAHYTGKRPGINVPAAVLAVLAALALATSMFFFFQARGQEPSEPQGVPVGNSTQQGQGSDGSDNSAASAESSASGSSSAEHDPAGGESSSAGSSPAKSPDAAEPPAEPEYDFGQPAPKSAEVDNSYFADAAFVGDSRTDGFMIYSGIGCGRNLTSNGLSIFKLAEKKTLTIGGVNELGVYNDDGFYESYCNAIDEIRKLQPGAVIYIQGLIPLNEEQIVEANGNKFNLTNEHLRVYDGLMRKVAQEKQVVYLDLYDEFVDENGELPAQTSRDGVHLKKDACIQWLDYLKTHTVDYDELYPDGPPPVETPEPAEPDVTTVDGSVQG